ncbi:MAG: SRPBCC family protein [Nitriliruptorales bacterium]|nr:SRPBCC family protein [Nitriliruptorales bacterium]
MAASLDLRGTRDLDVPIETVFDYVADARNDPNWCPLVEGTEQIGGNGPEPGAVYVWQQRQGEDDIVPTEVTLTVVERPNRLEWSLDNEGMSYESWMTFQDLGNGRTRVSQRNQTTAKHAPEEMGPLMQAQMEQVFEQQMDNLERILAA